MTANARTIEHMVGKLKANKLHEIMTLGESIKQETETIIPTLLRHADRQSWRDRIVTSSGTHTISNVNDVKLVRYDHDAVQRVVGAMTYGAEQSDYDSLKCWSDTLSPETNEAILSGTIRGEHDPAPREFEHTNYTFEITLDYGAFRDIQRHRLTTQTIKLLSPLYGFEVPDEIVEFGYGPQFTELMNRGQELYLELEQNIGPEAAQYCLPMAYRIQFLMTCNLRELCHLIELRSKPQGHKSYRAIANRMFDLVNEVHPMLAQLIRVNQNMSDKLERI